MVCLDTSIRKLAESRDPTTSPGLDPDYGDRVCSNTLRCCIAQHTPKQEAHSKHRRYSWKRPMGERDRDRTVRLDQSKARCLHRSVAGRKNGAPRIPETRWTRAH